MKSLVYSLVIALFYIFVTTSAYSAPPQVSLTVNIQGDGSVTSEPVGIDCPTDCVESYKKASRVTLEAVADPGGLFLRWEGACIGTQLTCDLKLIQSTSVTAIFQDLEETVPAPLLKTGQELCWDETDNVIPCEGTGQDGDYQAGETPPTPRFVDNGDATVTDKATGLTWLKHPKCMPQLTWYEALEAANNLYDGQCNLTDGSNPGDWRLPNAKELQSLSSFTDTLEPGSDITQPPFVYEFGVACGPADVWNWSSTARRNQPSSVYVFEQQSYLRVWPKTGFGCAFAVKGGL